MLMSSSSSTHPGRLLPVNSHLHLTKIPSSSSKYLRRHDSPFRHARQTRTRKSSATAYSSLVYAAAARKEDIVIVGAGIAGLATALSLHRLGIRSLVLEQADSLRTGGTSLTLFKNGWGVLDAMGVGNDLRSQFLEIQGVRFKTSEGRELRSFNFKDADESQEVRAVERRVLLQTLADQLPPDSIRFSSKLSNICRSKSGEETMLELADGTQLSSKIVVGCDGVRSPVAKWLGFSEPRYVGYCAFRGLAFYPDGQPLEPRVNYIYGKGMRAGYVPVSSTKVYWFICYNSASPGPKITDPSELMNQARTLVKDWSTELPNIITNTPNDTLSRTPIEDRWLWPVVTPSASKDSVVLAGDAWHPMTPNLGQGGCCALEDAVVLAKRIAAGVMRSGSFDEGSIKEGLMSYEKERWGRIFPMCARANLVGAILQWENPLFCSLRDNLIVPKLVRVGPLLEHTNFNCEPL